MLTESTSPIVAVRFVLACAQRVAHFNECEEVGLAIQAIKNWLDGVPKASEQLKASHETLRVLIERNRHGEASSATFTAMAVWGAIGTALFASGDITDGKIINAVFYCQGGAASAMACQVPSPVETDYLYDEDEQLTVPSRKVSQILRDQQKARHLEYAVQNAIFSELTATIPA